MVGKVLGIRELEQFSSRRSSVYVDPDCEKFFELPLFIAASSNDITTKCQCWQLSPGNKSPRVKHKNKYINSGKSKRREKKDLVK